MKNLFLAMAVAIVTATAVSAQDSDKEDKRMDTREIPPTDAVLNSISGLQA